MLYRLLHLYIDVNGRHTIQCTKGRDQERGGDLKNVAVCPTLIHFVNACSVSTLFHE